VTLGRRRRDGSYTRLGHRATHDVAQDLFARLGARAEIAQDLRHPHVLRHTFATRYYRQTRDLAGLQRLLGHADPKTTMVYVDDSPAERERLMLLASDEPPTLDLDREASVTAARRRRAQSYAALGAALSALSLWMTDGPAPPART